MRNLDIVACHSTLSSLVMDRSAEIGVATDGMQGHQVIGRMTEDLDILLAFGGVFVLPGLGALAVDRAMAECLS